MTLVTFQSRYKLGQCLEFLVDLFTEDEESGHMMKIVTGTGRESLESMLKRDEEEQVEEVGGRTMG